jgi:methionyl-tRNA formyltransferase
VSIMRPVAEMDAGPVCLQRSLPIAPDDDYGSLSRRLSEMGGALLVEALDDQPDCRDQPDQGVTIAPKIAPEDRRLDPAHSAHELERRVRALHPHIGAFVELPGGERLGVLRAIPAVGAQLEPGELAADDDRLLFGCCDGALELLEVKPPGGRPMDAGAYLRGHAAKLRGGV